MMQNLCWNRRGSWQWRHFQTRCISFSTSAILIISTAGSVLISFFAPKCDTRPYLHQTRQHFFQHKSQFYIFINLISKFLHFVINQYIDAPLFSRETLNSLPHIDTHVGFYFLFSKRKKTAVILTWWFSLQNSYGKMVIFKWLMFSLAVQRPRRPPLRHACTLYFEFSSN